MPIFHMWALMPQLCTMPKIHSTDLPKQDAWDAVLRKSNLFLPLLSLEYVNICFPCVLFTGVPTYLFHPF